MDDKWIITTKHPKYNQLKEMIVDELQRQMIFEIYIDLSEVREWHNLNIKKLYNSIDKFVVTGHQLASSEQSVIIPVNNSDEMSLDEINELLTIVEKQFPFSITVLALIDQDSTIAYTRLEKGLVAPEHPNQIEKKHKWQKHKLVKRRNKYFIEDTI